MPGNVNSQNSASNLCSPSRNPAVNATLLTNPPHTNSSRNFKGSNRVSHRYYQFQCNNVNQRSKFQDNNGVFENHTAPQNHVSNSIRNDLKITRNWRGIQFSDLRSAGSNVSLQVEEILPQFDALDLRDNRNRKPETSAKSNKNTQIRYPNFRDLDLYPTENDIHRSGLPSLEPNKITGAYENIEHYLDVQFRLLREDFMGSVRNGIKHYLSLMPSNSPNPPQLKYDGIRIYPKTQFERIQSTKNNKLGILINFDPEGKMRHFKWKESKRFMFGSLLLFTVDNFDHFFHCTVVERNIDALRAGKILVSLTNKVREDSHFFKRPYLMAECDAFFDPYFLVMKLLCEFNENTFPMPKYIVEGLVDHQYPKYINDFGILWVKDRMIAPITVKDDFWPTADELLLDQHQYKAFKAALTRDFCVIQGPPGTGKTFIGLKIVQNIWHNAKSFNHKLQLPILVVCSTNHAVDQFLEGVLKFTKNVVRVGGQSRSEVMKQYNLRERAKAENKFFADKFLRGSIKSCQQEIDRIGLQMKCVEKPSGILSVNLLSDVVEPKYQYLMRDNNSLIQWLLPNEWLGKHYDERDFKKFRSDYENRNTATLKKLEVDEFEGGEDDVDEEEEIWDPEQKTSFNVDDECYYSLSLQQLVRNCLKGINRYYQLKKDEFEQKYHVENFYNKKVSCKNEIIRNMKQLDYLKNHLSNPVYKKVPLGHELDPTTLNSEQRWIVYWQWTMKLVDLLSKELKELQETHSRSVQQFEECKQKQDLQIMRKADVVGMTTSGAARLNTLLKSLQPAVVIIEEAGEVLETHVIASLTNKCQHVILIGDHEQLRPITAIYALSKNYNMNVSLFERLVKNGMDCPVLNVQHRMRPEISCLISPVIYPNLENHNSVLNFESIRGVEKNVFFVNHNVFEKTSTDSTSKQNEYEAKFVICFTKYLIQQQYDPTKITILTTYSAQKILLRNLQRQYSVDAGVKCIVVDKYQGEENDIIVLSLVRSNTDGNIGFLETKNRVCVALSRAKKGFFILGNMSCLAKKSVLWRSIKKTLMENEAIGNKLPLYCSIHEKRTLVASVDDFNQVSCGGCDAECNVRLDCGHICQSKCHYTSGDHPRIKCTRKCAKYHCLRCRKPCSKLCWEKCDPCCNCVLKTARPCDDQKSSKPASDDCAARRVRDFFFHVQNSRHQQSNNVRNRFQNSTSFSSLGGGTLPKHSYCFAPHVSPKRRSFLSSCCLL